MLLKLRESNQYLTLYASCVPVNGNQRSIICDLQNNEYHLIPNILYDIITDFKGKTINEIYNFFPKKNHNILSEYFSFLLSKNLAFQTHEPNLFPEIEKTFHFPSVISNSIIDIGESTSLDHLGKFINELSDLGCRALEIRFFSTRPKNEIEFVLDKTINTSLRNVEILIPDDKSYNKNWLNKLFSRNQRLSTINIHSSDINKLSFDEENQRLINYITTQIDSSQCCGVVNNSLFTVNIPHFMESLNFNTCLNRKVSLDEYGIIKNCPSSTIEFGHISEQSVFEVILNNKFKELWSINKDQINTCKDCEFRYICTDCRIFIKDSDNKYSKPSKCTYNPYEAKWED
jgi:SPASM domain peptide maturase of grasp-with-spasm system